MTMARRIYTGEFKFEAVHLLETSGKSACQLERELGIGGGCLSRWKREFAEEGEHAFPGPGRLMPDQKVSLVAQTRLSREFDRISYQSTILDTLFSSAPGPQQPENRKPPSNGWPDGPQYTKQD